MLRILKTDICSILRHGHNHHSGCRDYAWNGSDLLEILTVEFGPCVFVTRVWSLKQKRQQMVRRKPLVHTAQMQEGGDKRASGGSEQYPKRDLTDDQGGPKPVSPAGLSRGS